MGTQIFQPAAEAVMDQLDPALREAILRADDAMEQFRSNRGAAMVAVWADESEDPGITYVQPGGQSLCGQKRLEETFHALDSLPNTPATLTVEYERIVANDDLAFTVSTERGLVFPPGLPEGFDLVGQVTHIYKRFGDTWKIIHRHVHGMNKESLHTYDIEVCPECGIELMETAMKIHRMSEHGQKWSES
jgi:ketosteroid isomerase-like protein